MEIAPLVEEVLGPELPVSIRAYDGSSAGSPEGPAVVVRSADAFRRILGSPGQLGLARAYVAGDIEVEGDIIQAMTLLKHRLSFGTIRPAAALRLARVVGLDALRPLPPPAVEARLKGRQRSPARDAAAVAYHYELPVEFFALVLGPSMTYTCAIFESEADTLDQAQANKHDLICRKLGLEPGMHLLDAGCGWGGLILHAARHYGVRAEGITLSARQVAYAQKAIADAGLSHLVSVDLRDYRETSGGAYDAISAVGVFEHVGLSRGHPYFPRLHELLRPGGRLLNQAISRPAGAAHARRRSFVQRYVFPDGRLEEVGDEFRAMERAGFEVLSVESFRPHYTRTLRRWLANLEHHWEEAVALVGLTRARMWRLHLAGFALSFDDRELGLYQALGAKAA